MPLTYSSTAVLKPCDTGVSTYGFASSARSTMRVRITVGRSSIVVLASFVSAAVVVPRSMLRSIVSSTEHSSSLFSHSSQTSIDETVFPFSVRHFLSFSMSLATIGFPSALIRSFSVGMSSASTQHIFPRAHWHARKVHFALRLQSPQPCVVLAHIVHGGFFAHSLTCIFFRFSRSAADTSTWTCVEAFLMYSVSSLLRFCRVSTEPLYTGSTSSPAASAMLMRSVIRSHLSLISFGAFLRIHLKSACGASRTRFGEMRRCDCSRAIASLMASLSMPSLRYWVDSSFLKSASSSPVCRAVRRDAMRDAISMPDEVVPGTWRSTSSSSCSKTVPLGLVVSISVRSADAPHMFAAAPYSVSVAISSAISLSSSAQVSWRRAPNCG